MANNEEHLVTSAESMQMATAVGPKASIQGVRLLNISAMLGHIPPESAKFFRHRRSCTSTRAPDGTLEVDIKCSLDIASQEEEKAEPPVSIEAKYRLVYKIEELTSFDDEHLRAFAEINGYFNAWPFWRELTTSLLARTQTGYFLLPTLRVDVKESGESLSQ